MDPTTIIPPEISDPDERRAAVAALRVYPLLHEARNERERQALERLKKRGYVNFIDLRTRKGWMAMEKLTWAVQKRQMKGPTN
jgi:hypothetical protein